MPLRPWLTGELRANGHPQSRRGSLLAGLYSLHIVIHRAQGAWLPILEGRTMDWAGRVLDSLGGPPTELADLRRWCCGRALIPAWRWWYPGVLGLSAGRAGTLLRSGLRWLRVRSRVPGACGGCRGSRGVAGRLRAGGCG